MAANSKIEWTNETWMATKGCTEVSAGCEHCYAERMSKRLAAIGRAHRKAGRSDRKLREYGEVIGADGRWNGKVVLCHDALSEPMKWKKSRMVFVNSMSDLLHPGVPDSYIRDVFIAMSRTRTAGHRYQVLTKRPERMRDLIQLWIDSGLTFHEGCTGRLPSFIWLGTSCEDQATHDERRPLLSQCPAALRFLSLEPLLGPIPKLQLEGIGWVIVGGETGPGARPCRIEWIRDIIEQCRAAGVAVFVKQLGSNPVREPYGANNGVGDGEARRLGLIKNRTGGDMAEWPEDLRVREWPAE